MQQVQTQQSRPNKLADSSWITDVWDWIQQLLARAVPSVLFVTMIVACYGLIPGAPPIPNGVNVFMFVLQFIALDVGGITLDQTAKRRGMSKRSFPRIVAFSLIGVTLVTITYAGIEHAFPGSPNWDLTTYVEVTLVVARSILTVFYGYAIHALKSDQEVEQDRVAELEEALSVKGDEVLSVTARLNTEVNTLRVNLNTQIDGLNAQLNTRDNELNTLRVKVNTLTQENENLCVKLNGKEAQLADVKGSRESSLRDHEEATQRTIASVKSQLAEAESEVESLRSLLLKAQGELHAEKQKVLTLTSANRDLNTRLNSEVNTNNGEVNALRVKVNTLASENETLTGQLNTLRVKVNTPEQNHINNEIDQSKIVQLDAQESENYEPRIRTLLTDEPGLSGREIARRLGCSVPTACRWKKSIEQSEQSA